MKERELVNIYKKQIEFFLATLDIYKGTNIINNDKKLNLENKQFIKDKMLQMNANNVNEKLLDIAIDELLPYLYQKN